MVVSCLRWWLGLIVDLLRFDNFVVCFTVYAADYITRNQEKGEVD